MKVIFLGTGTSQGVPVIACTCKVCQSIDYRDKRLRSSILIQHPKAHFVIDTGPDFRQQMLSERINQLDAVLFTHAHKDHTAGLDDIRSYNFIQKKEMPIYAEDDVIAQLKNEFSYIFNELKYPGVPQVQLNTITNQKFEISGISIVPIRVLHYKMPVLGFRIEDFTYITDANFIDQKEINKIKGSKVVVLNALQKESHISHFTLDQAIDIARIIDAPATYFTHISHKLGTHREVSAQLPDGIFLAHDGLVINF